MNFDNRNAYLGQKLPQCFEEGECTQSLFLGDYPSEDAQTCLELCQYYLECEYFTWYGDEEKCVVFANCDVFSNNTCSNCLSGARTCEGKALADTYTKCIP